MTHTPPSEAAASSRSNLPDEHALEHIARNEAGFYPAAMQAMAREILRMRAQCPPTAEVEKLREGAREANLLHLRLSKIGDALREAGRPGQRLGDEVERIRDLAGERDAWRHQAHTRGDDLNRIRSLVPNADEGEPTFDVVRQALRSLRDSAVLAQSERDEARRIAEQNGKAAAERLDLITRLHAILCCTFPCEPTLEKQAEALVAAAKNGAPPVVGDCLMLAHKPGAWSQEADEFFIYRRVSNTPWVTVHWRHGPGISNNQPTVKVSDFFGFDPDEARTATIGGCKVGPATGQPRTEVPVGPDGSETVVELGEAFRRNLANAVDCLPSDGRPIDAGTIRIAIRNLHAAVAELAKVVGRIGGAK